VAVENACARGDDEAGHVLGVWFLGAEIGGSGSAGRDLAWAGDWTEGGVMARQVRITLDQGGGTA
jgi:hypothetical protein